MKRSPLLAVALGLAALLLATGLGVAHWSDTVELSGQASMGYLIWDIETVTLHGNTDTVMDFLWSIRDPGDDIAPGDPGGPRLGTYTGIVAISVVNAYPNAFGAIALEAQNEGSIPVRLYVWVEPGPPADPSSPDYNPACEDLLDYILLNPGYDALDHALNNPNVAPYFGGSIDPYDPGDYNVPERVAGGWDEYTGFYTGSGVHLTDTVANWIALTGSSTNAVPLESTHTSGTIIKISDGTLSHDDDNILMPGESSYTFIWIGFSPDLQDREDLMGLSCGDNGTPYIIIHYVAVQAVP